MTDEDIIGFLKVVEYLITTSPNEGKVFIEVNHPIDDICGLIEFYSSKDKRPDSPIEGCCFVADKLDSYHNNDKDLGSLKSHIEDFRKTVELFQQGFHGTRNEYDKKD